MCNVHQTLRHTMEKIIRVSAATSNSPTTKELHYMLRSLAPAACREPATFTSVARDILRGELQLVLLSFTAVLVVSTSTLY